MKTNTQPSILMFSDTNSVKATPMSYRLANGQQYVVITVGGGGAFGAGDHVIAFKLGDRR